MDEAMDLHDAAGDGDVVTIRTLVAQGADVEAVDDDGDRPLHVAALEGHVEAVKTLVELTHPADTSRSNLASALALLSRWRLSKP
jgi:ankyrin repeat protein|tara:strand:- start:68 stop:322 length:255 start_codon:yes stop_codon:yes gene_type:complete